MVPNTGLGDTVFAEEGVFSKPSEALLYSTSPIGDTSPLLHILRLYFSASYHWTLDCFSVIGISVQERADAENSANGEWRGALHFERSNGCRKPSRVEITIRIRSERSPHSLGFERPN